jgi:hypothetical protein
MIAAKLNLLNTSVNRLPGWARLWLAFTALSLPGYAISLYLYRRPDPSDLITSTLGLWVIFSLMFLAIVYLIKVVIEMFIWIWRGFTESTQVVIQNAVLPSIRVFLAVAFVILLAAYFRFDIAVLGDTDGRYYHYVVWDRWTGNVYADTARYRPKQP